jgi:phage terminase large subunit-like protein
MKLDTTERTPVSNALLTTIVTFLRVGGTRLDADLLAAQLIDEANNGQTRAADLQKKFEEAVAEAANSKE